MTLPSTMELAGRELTRRIAQFRHELNAIGDTPTRPELERLIARVTELGLTEDEVADEIAQVRACIEALALTERLGRGELPLADSPEAIESGQVCHFICRVRFGRRRVDQSGHLVMSPARLEFLGALDVSVAWPEISAIRRSGREILVFLQEGTRPLRLCCRSHAEAARGGAIAEHLAGVARVEADLGSRYHVRA